MFTAQVICRVLNPRKAFLDKNVISLSKLWLHNTAEKSELKLVQLIKKNVPPFGKIEINQPPFDIIIKPANPNEYPDMDTAIIKLFSNRNKIGKCDLVLKNDNNFTLSSECFEKLAGNEVTYCQLELPIKYDVKADLNGSYSLNIENMEPDYVELSTTEGNITTKSLKTCSGKIGTDSGNITCSGVMQGSVKFTTKSGNVTGRRFQGLNVEMETESGNVEVESVYSDVSSFKTESGNLNLKNLHQESSVHVTKNGNVRITGLDGSIQAQLGTGHNEIQISNLRSNSRIELSSGKLVLKVPEESSFSLNINAGKVQLPKALRDKRQNADTRLDVVCDNGEVVVENQDWFSSLGLGFKE